MIKIKELFSRNKYGLFFFFGLLIRMVINMPYRPESLSDPFTYLFYIVDYKTAGFVPRGLIGSAASLFSDRMPLKLIYCISLVMTLIFVIVASLFVNRIFRMDFEGKTALFIVLCTFLLLSNENLYFFDTAHFGIIDIYFIMITLVILLFSEKKLLRWFIPLLCFLCMSIYEGYVFAFMAVVGIVLLYVCIQEKSVSSRIVFFMSISAVLAAFIYFYILFRADHWNMLRYGTYEELKQALLNKTDAEISWIMEQLYYFTSSMTLFTDGRWDVAAVLEYAVSIQKKCLPTAIIFCSITVFIWIFSRKHENNKSMKWIWILCIAAPLTAAPFLVFSEQMKYISYFTISQFMLLMYFAVKEKSVQNALVYLDKLLVRKPYILCIPWGLMLFFRGVW